MKTVDFIACTHCGTVLLNRSRPPRVDEYKAKEYLRLIGHPYDIAWTRVGHCPSCRELRLFDDIEVVGEDRHS